MHGQTTEHILERLLEDNEQLAQHNREHFDRSKLLAVNLMSAPGAGKTTLIAAAVKMLRQDYRCAVIEGDMTGELDADRLRALDIPAIQISTGRACHLDAQMLAQVLHDETLPETDLLFIENVGNLVCPAEFPLGEHRRIVLLSVTEGDDKPFKYPVIFHRCDAVVFTKCDLLPYVDFDSARAKGFVRDLNANAEIFEISTVSGQGMDRWTDWLKKQISANRNQSDIQENHKHHVHIGPG